MTPPSEKLAGSLDVLRSLQERGVVAVRAADLPRSHRERLVRHGFLLPVVTDAYHSLSIEGYRVSPTLIARVRSGDWNPERHPADRAHRDALAARGYWQAYQAVRDSVRRAVAGEPPGSVAEAGAVRPAARRAGARRARRARALPVRLRASLPGRQRPRGPVSDERDADGVPLSLDRHPGRAPGHVHGALEAASVRQDIGPFTDSLAGLVGEANQS